MTFLVHDLLEETASRMPDRTAIIVGDRVLRYGDLARESAAIAAALAELGIRRGDRVGIYAKKSARSIAATFAIMRAGAAYVPLDASAPVSRIAYTIGHCDLRAIVTTTALLGALRAHAPALPALRAAITLDDAPAPDANAWDELLRTAPRAPVRTVDTDLAYVLYTSGSTGVPKGVAIDHRASMTFVSWATRRFALTHEDRVTSHAPLHFDLSTFDLFASVAAGATIVVVPDAAAAFPFKLAQLIERERITVTYLVPSALSMMVVHGDLARRDFSALRAVLFAGEVFPLKYLREWLARAPGARFHNLYGPTETNVCTAHEVDREDARTRTQPLPIGRAIDNVDVFAIDERGELVKEPGDIGELWTRGAGIARGYFGDPERTAQSFVASPLAIGVDERAYRTGDRVRLAQDGSYEFLGRFDHLVKTRGYRVELGEIETALASHAAVAAAAAVPIADELVGHRIHAFVSIVDGAHVTPAELERFCAERIPRYMVPETIEVLAPMPLTSSGKIDRAALSGHAAQRAGKDAA